MMPTDEERREVARRLRAVPVLTLAGIDGDGNRREWEMVPLKKLSHAVGVDYDGNNDVEGHLNVLSCLADLIEPSCDRDALLALADDMDRSRSRCDFCIKHGECDWTDETMCLESMMDDYARCIREALGVEE